MGEISVEQLTVTKEHVNNAQRAGACGEATLYRPGTPIEKVRCDHLQWYADRFPDEAAEASRRVVEAAGLKLRGTVPLALFGYGYGSGYGDGYGYGYGSGSGYGYGYGYGEDIVK
jgi:hypothetical protein